MAVKQLIERVELDSSAASITFSSIPQTFAHLEIVLSGRNLHSSVTSYFTLSFNASTANFAIVGLFGDGSSASSFTSPSNFGSEVAGANATSNTFSNIKMLISNYTSSANKSFTTDGVAENNATLAQQTITAGLWSDTSAITSTTLTSAIANFDAGASVSLYGITRGGDGTVTTA